MNLTSLEMQVQQLNERNQRLVDYKNSEVGNLKGLDCPICLNKGYVLINDEGYIVAKKCSCLQQRRLEKFNKGLNFNQKLEDYKTDKPLTKRIKELAIENLQGDEWFTILGQSGSTKTTICTCMCNELKKSKKVLYLQWNTYTRDLKANQLEDEFENIFNRYSQVEVLYIDDLLKGKYTDTDITYLYDLINYRYNHRLKTLISGERLIDELAEIDEAVAGRIKERSGKFLINIKGKEYNQR